MQVKQTRVNGAMTLIIVTHRTTLLPMGDLVLELGAGKSGRAPCATPCNRRLCYR